MSFFNLFKRAPTDPNPGEMWKGNPLVIADAEGAVVFAGRIDVEVVHLDSGKLEMRTLAEDKPSHTLREAEEFMAPEGIAILYSGPYDRLQKGLRNGVSYYGIGESGEESYWYFNAVAEAYLAAKNNPAASI